jgi:glycogen synthase
VDGLVQTVSKAMALKMNRPAEWRKICANAADTRFNWRDSAALYIEKLYRTGKKSKK